MSVPPQRPWSSGERDGPSSVLTMIKRVMDRGLWEQEVEVANPDLGI